MPKSAYCWVRPCSAAARDAPGGAARCNSVAWHPGAGGGFVSLHSDGNAYAYHAARDAAVDPCFPPLRAGWLYLPSWATSRERGA